MAAVLAFSACLDHGCGSLTAGKMTGAPAEWTLLSNAVAFVSNKRVCVGVCRYETAQVKGARVDDVPRSTGSAVGAIVCFGMAVLAFPGRALIAGAIYAFLKWLFPKWGALTIGADNPLVTMIAVAIFLTAGITGVLFLREWAKRRFDVFLRVDGLDIFALRTDNEGMARAIDQAVREAIKAHERGFVPAHPQPSPQVQPVFQPPPQAWAYVPPPYSTYGEPFTGERFDPALLAKPEPRVTYALIISGGLAVAMFSAAIFSAFTPLGVYSGWLWRAGKWLSLIAFILELVWVYRAWSAVPKWCRATALGHMVSPVEAVVFHFIPILNLGWVYHVHIGVAEATNAILDAYAEHSRDAPRASPALAFWGLTLTTFPGINVLALPLLLGRHMLHCDAAQLRMHELLRAGMPAYPLHPPRERPGQQSLIRYRKLGPALFLFLIIFGAGLLSALVGAAKPKVATDGTRPQSRVVEKAVPPTDPDPVPFTRGIAEGLAACGSRNPTEPLPVNVESCAESRAARPLAPLVHDYTVELDSARGAHVRARPRGKKYVVSEMLVSCPTAACVAVDPSSADGGVVTFPVSPPFAAWSESRPQLPTSFGTPVGIAFDGPKLRIVMPDGVAVVSDRGTSSRNASGLFEHYARSSAALVAVSANGQVVIKRTNRIVSVIDLASGMEQPLSRTALRIPPDTTLHDVSFSLSSDGRVVGVALPDAFVAFDRVSMKVVGDEHARNARIAANGREVEVRDNIGAIDSRDLATRKSVVTLPSSTIRAAKGGWAAALASGPDTLGVNIVDPLTGAVRSKVSGLNESKSSISAISECLPELPGGPTRLAVARDFEVTVHDMPSGILVSRHHQSYAGRGRVLLACGPGGKDVALMVGDALAHPDAGARDGGR